MTRSRIMAESTVAMPATEQTQAVTPPETRAAGALYVPAGRYLRNAREPRSHRGRAWHRPRPPGSAGGPEHPDAAWPDPGADAGGPALPRIHAGQLLPAVRAGGTD